MTQPRRGGRRMSGLRVIEVTSPAEAAQARAEGVAAG
jgi:hypothetical protein